ncbi:ATP-dependent RNA helicase DHX30-like isoform X2 [Pectinophora gossypiella]|nr:ATP-dependent RNA helicase DHX30-like isoform X2 [Pectinophora gossypiella]
MPRVTLNELLSRTPQRIFEIHYKQSVAAPKGSRKKSKVVQNDWTCTYAFIWPDKIKFEGTAIAKRQAAEKAATQALHYLYKNKRIDSKGLPIYDKEKIKEIKSTLQEPVRISISDKSMERIDKIWAEYEDGIKDIYEETFKVAAQKVKSHRPVMTKDSTIDQEDVLAESELALEELEDTSELKVRVHPVYGRTITPPSEGTLQRRDRVLRQRFENYEERTPLPIDHYTDVITSTLDRSRVVLLVGAAGCGKSTRAPAAILSHCGAATAALVAEPRRVAAIGLAERVAHELGEEVGDSIGYQVRLQSKLPRPPAGSVLYCTSGVLLRRLQSNPGLEGCTHVFIDEAHERDVNTDITLLLLRKALDINANLKIVVMSATLDTEVFTRYFDSCPVIEVPGRTFPVEVSYLDDIEKTFNIRLPNTMDNCRKEDAKPQINCQEVVEVIKAVDKTQPEGAILVFLPGWAEISLAKQLLDAVMPVSTHIVQPVHSRLSTTDQTRMFARPPPGIRKVVLATNIAETSITIPDVVYVVDCGAHKENTLAEGTGTASLETVWVSLAGAKQRAGRAGRVQPGHCYRLYTKEKEAEFNPHTTPEILRIPLDQTVLNCKTYAPEDKIENFLSQLPEPPTQQAIRFAVNDLIELGALTPSEQLTRLGVILSSMTLPPRAGRALINAVAAGAAVAMADVVAHVTASTALFVDAANRREEIREIKRRYSTTSDHAALHWIQEEYERMLEEGNRERVDEWCRKLGIRKDRLNYVKALSSLYLEQLFKSGVIEPTIDPEELNRFSDIDELTVALLLSGSNALLRTKKVIKAKGKLKTVNALFTSTGERAHIGSESVNHDIVRRPGSTTACYMSAVHSSERRALLAYDSSVIPPHAAVLAASGPLRVDYESDGNDDTSVLYLPRHKYYVHMPASQANHIVKAREMLWMTLQYFIERDIKTMDFDENTRISRFKVRLIKTICRLLVEGHREYVEGKNVEEFIDRSIKV